MTRSRAPAAAIHAPDTHPLAAWPASPLLTAAATGLAGLWLVRAVGPRALDAWTTLLAGAVSAPAASSATSLTDLWPLIGAFLLFALALAAVAVVTHLLQTRGTVPGAAARRPLVGFRPHRPGLLPLAAAVLLAVGAWRVGPAWTAAVGSADQAPAALLAAGFEFLQTLALLAVALGLLDLAWRHRERQAALSTLAEQAADDEGSAYRGQVRQRQAEPPAARKEARP